MIFGKKTIFKASDLVLMENELKESKLYQLGLKAGDGELAEKLGLKVEYVDDMDVDNEAELRPIENDKYNGLINLDKELENCRFAYIHEVIHYIFDVGYGNKVSKIFTRKKKGTNKEHEEQVTDYKTAAYIMPGEEFIEEIRKYDAARPRMDEIEFLNNLKDKYSQNDTTIFRRIKEVRILEKNNYFQSVEGKC